MAIDLSIIIVSWNVWDLLRACLSSLEQMSRPASTPGGLTRRFGPSDRDCIMEVIVVDNAGEDATADLLPARFPWVQLLRSQENLGFSGWQQLRICSQPGTFRLFSQSRYRTDPNGFGR